MKDRTYNLRELSREADVTERTVRYYIKEGLLPPPHGSGPFSRYSYEHWLRLQFIKRLKDEYLPLSEIKNLLESRSTGELDQLARRAGLIPESGNLPKGQPAVPAQTSDPLPGLIGGGSGRGQMLREQMASKNWPAPSVAASQANTGAFEAEAEYKTANFAPELEAAIDSFADVPEAASLSFADAEPPEYADLSENEPGQSTRPSPPLYGAPGQAKAAFSPPSFRAGAAPSMAPGAAPAPMPPGAPQSGAGARPPQSVNYSAPASPVPLRAMRMSRFVANEVAGDIAPGEFEAAKEEPPVPAQMPMMARMAAPMAVPDAGPQPENTPETVTGQTWERIEVAPGVELHIEKRIADTYRPALANLLQAARRLFGPKEI